MKHKIIAFISLLTFAMYLLPISIVAATPVPATKVLSTVSIDDRSVSFNAYNIQNFTYFKLRDIAYVLNDSPSQFEVTWDAQAQTISLISGQPYTSIGGEMSSSNSLATQTVLPIDATLLVNGKLMTLPAYSIDGNTYFKLRDLGEQLNFTVTWDEVHQRIQIQSKNLIPQKTINPWDYVKLLGKGMDVDWSKTNQGRTYYNTQAVKDFKKSGISHVRIRIADQANEDLLLILDQQINDCLDNGLIPIIAYQADEFKNAPTEENIQSVINWWSTVATRYKDYSPLLSFDLLIEATDALNKSPEKLNEIYERLVTEIRKTNPTRIIMMSPRLRSDPDYLKELKIPTAHNGYMMAEWHFYASGPSKTNERKLWTTGTPAEKKLITDKIDAALTWQKQTNIPTWVGAWMPGNYNDGNDYTVPEQVTFATYMSDQLTAAGIPFAVNSDTKYYDRETNLWIPEMRPVFNAIFQQNTSFTQ